MSFLDKYLTYTSQTEPPANFNKFTGYGIISSLLGGRVFLDVGSAFTAIPNLYIIYVAEPGKRKTTSMKIGRQLIKDIVQKTTVDNKDNKKVPLIPFSASVSSATQFIKNMDSDSRIVNIPGEPKRVISPMTVCASELSSLLQISGGEMIGVLTDLWDSDVDYDYQTGNAGHLMLPLPYLTIMGCATPKWISSQLKGDIISGGFSRRALFIYETTFTRRSLQTELDTELYKDLIGIGKQIIRMKGKMRWEDGVLEWFDSWYLNPERDLKLQEDPTTAGYANSKHTQVMKLAVCIAAANLDMTMRKQYIEQALVDLTIIEPNIPNVFKGLGRNVSAPLISEVMDFIVEKGGMVSDAELTKRFYKDAQSFELKDILYQLVKSEQLFLMETEDTIFFLGQETKKRTDVYCTTEYYEQNREQLILRNPNRTQLK